MSRIFSCFRSNKQLNDARRPTIQQQPMQARVDPSQQNSKSRVLPSYGGGAQGTPDEQKVCARCERPLNKGHVRDGSLGGKTDREGSQASSAVKDSFSAQDKAEAGAQSFAINDENKPYGATPLKKNQQSLCQICLKKENGGQTATSTNMEMLSSGSQRDDVSQSTMAAHSYKTNPSTTGRAQEMNVTMNSYNGSDRASQVPRMSAEENLRNERLVRQYREMRYKKYFFLEPSQQRDAQLAKDSSSRRISDELKLYHQLKNDDRVQEIGNSLCYYIINSAWVAKWSRFVKKEGPMPGPIDNEPIARKIYTQRIVSFENKYQIHDNSIGIDESRSCHVLSQDFWNMFESRYSCDMIIQVRKYSRVEDILNNYEKNVGDAWSSMPPDLQTHYEPMAKELLAMPLARRHEVESKHMDALQSDNKLWKRYYAISTNWVTKWLDYVQSPDKSQAVHPGPVTNQDIERKLTQMGALEDLDINKKNEFYNVSKHLFYFFISLYGGGPIVFQNKLWEETEAKWCEMRQTEPTEDELRTPRRPIHNTRHSNNRPADPMVRIHDTLPGFEDGIVGLENNTYYCYMNACLQCLLPITELRDHYVMQNYYAPAERGGVTRENNYFDFSNKLHEFYNVVYSKSSRQKRWVIKPTLKALLRQRFDPIQQHDSHEFMVYLLEQLQEEETLKNRPVFDGSSDTKPIPQICEEFNRSYCTKIDQIFSGIMQTIVKCGKCRHESVTSNPFMTQSLQHKTTLVKCLQDYYTENSIDDLYTCESCHKKTKAKVRHLLVKLPKVLVFHIKRFDQSFRKIEKHTAFPETLDMSPFCLDRVEPNLRGSTQYKLYALTVHHGKLSGGHYIAFAKRDDDRWYNFNDEYFSEAQISDVLKQQAYLLFYRQVS